MREDFETTHHLQPRQTTAKRPRRSFSHIHIDERYPQPGERIYVRFGSIGKQIAEVVSVSKRGNIYVRKYRASSDSWTNVTRIRLGEILRKPSRRAAKARPS